MRTFTEEEVEILIQKCREMDKHKTNFERIKAMSVEEMAEWLERFGTFNQPCGLGAGQPLQWLQQEVEE